MILAVRDLPHHDEHRASVERQLERGKEPRTLDGLLHWYVRQFRAETPERLHIRETWHDRVSPHEDVSPVGGSLLGTPAYAGGFRALLEGSPFAIGEDGYYVTPMRAALAGMARHHGFTVRYLLRLAQAEGDWSRLADDLAYPHELVEVFTEAALRKLWRRYTDRSLKGMT